MHTPTERSLQAAAHDRHLSLMNLHTDRRLLSLEIDEALLAGQSTVKLERQLADNWSKTRSLIHTN